MDEFKFCPKCGAKVKATAKFCPKCGFSFAQFNGGRPIIISINLNQAIEVVKPVPGSAITITATG